MSSTGPLADPIGRTKVLTIDPMTAYTTVSDLNGCGAIVCVPTGGDFPLNIIFQEAGTRVIVVNKYGSGHVVQVLYGSEQTWYLAAGQAISLISTGDSWVLMGNVIFT